MQPNKPSVPYTSVLYPANPIGDSTQRRIGSTLEGSLEKPKGVLQLEYANYGEPTCSEVIKGETLPSLLELMNLVNEPRAWLKNGKWVYNYAGTLRELKHIKRKLPTEAEIFTIIHKIDGSPNTKRMIIDNSKVQIRDDGVSSHIWTGDGFVVFLGLGTSPVRTNYSPSKSDAYCFRLLRSEG